LVILEGMIANCNLWNSLFPPVSVLFRRTFDFNVRKERYGDSKKSNSRFPETQSTLRNTTKLEEHGYLTRVLQNSDQTQSWCPQDHTPSQIHSKVLNRIKKAKFFNLPKAKFFNLPKALKLSGIPSPHLKSKIDQLSMHFLGHLSGVESTSFQWRMYLGKQFSCTLAKTNRVFCYCDFPARTMSVYHNFLVGCLGSCIYPLRRKR